MIYRHKPRRFEAMQEKAFPATMNPQGRKVERRPTRSTRFAPRRGIRRAQPEIRTRAFAALGETDRPTLRAELVDLWTSHNLASEPGRTTVDAEYLAVVGVRV